MIINILSRGSSLKKNQNFDQIEGISLVLNDEKKTTHEMIIDILSRGSS
jgi:hypothetical protein